MPCQGTHYHACFEPSESIPYTRDTNWYTAVLNPHATGPKKTPFSTGYNYALTVQLSHRVFCRDGAVKFHKSVSILHQDFSDLTVLAEECPDGLLVALCRQVPHVKLSHSFFLSRHTESSFRSYFCVRAPRSSSALLRSDFRGTTEQEELPRLSTVANSGLPTGDRALNFQKSREKGDRRSCALVQRL